MTTVGIPPAPRARHAAAANAFLTFGGPDAGVAPAPSSVMLASLADLRPCLPPVVREEKAVAHRGAAASAVNDELGEDGEAVAAGGVCG